MIGLSLTLTFDLLGQQFRAFSTYDDLKRFRIEVLRAGVIGQANYFDFTDNDSCNKTCIKYLGQVRTSKNRTYEVLTCFNVSGTSCRGSSRIVVYNSDNEYLGNYWVPLPSYLPDTIIDNSLAFSIPDPDCVNRTASTISFKNGLPRIITIHCSEAESEEQFLFSSDE